MLRGSPYDGVGQPQPRATTDFDRSLGHSFTYRTYLKPAQEGADFGLLFSFFGADQYLHPRHEADKDPIEPVELAARPG